MPRPYLASAASLLLSACAYQTEPPVQKPLTASSASADWRAAVSADDRALIEGLPTFWSRTLQEVPARHRAAIAAEGELLQPGAAREHPAVPPGSYRCRLVRLAPSQAGRPVQSFKEFFCYVRGETGNRLSFTKQTGTELPGGWLHPDGDRRLVLVGAQQREAGDNSVSYGDDPARDLVGTIERIGPFRWRLTIPARRQQSGLDIYELTPVPPEQQAPEPKIPSEAKADPR